MDGVPGFYHKSERLEGIHAFPEMGSRREKDPTTIEVWVTLKGGKHGDFLVSKRNQEAARADRKQKSFKFATKQSPSKLRRTKRCGGDPTKDHETVLRDEQGRVEKSEKEKRDKEAEVTTKTKS